MKRTSLHRIVLVALILLPAGLFAQTSGDDGIASPHPARGIIERPSEVKYFPAHQMDLNYGTFIQGVVTASPGQSGDHNNRSDVLVGGIAWHMLEDAPLMAFRIMEGTWGSETLIYSYTGDAAIRIRINNDNTEPQLFIKGTGRRGWFPGQLTNSFDLWRDYWSPTEQQMLEDFLADYGRNIMLFSGSTMDSYLNLPVGGQLVVPTAFSRNAACPINTSGPTPQAMAVLVTCTYSCGSDFDACSNECPVDAQGEPSGECAADCDTSLDWCLLAEGLCHTDSGDCDGLWDIEPGAPKPIKGGLGTRTISPDGTPDGSTSLDQNPPTYPGG